jgi:hypothetical protein
LPQQHQQEQQLTPHLYSQKRYERLLKAYGVTASGKSPTKSSKTVADAEAEPASPAGTPTGARKRSVPSTPSSNKKSKTAKTASVKKETKEEEESVKKEEEAEGSSLSGTSSLR